MPLGPPVVSLCPPDNGSQLDALAAYPFPLLTGSEFHIRPGPPLGPFVFIVKTVKLGTRRPIAPGKIQRIPDSEPTLFGRANQKQPAERPVRLASQVRLVFLIKDEDPQTRLDRFTGGHEPGKASTNDQQVRMLCLVHGIDTFPRWAAPRRLSSTLLGSSPRENGVNQY